jgi:preprotein translocase subunit SecG
VGTIAFLSQLLLLGLGTFLMIVILLQRGRGGGLAGAFGGLGGQSAFGTKAGDVFTRITIVMAVAWVIVAGGSGYFLRAGAEARSRGLGDPAAEISAGDDAEGDEVFQPLEEETGSEAAALPGDLPAPDAEEAPAADEDVPEVLPAPDSADPEGAAAADDSDQ